jgi:hypothetical protein
MTPIVGHRVGLSTDYPTYFRQSGGQLNNNTGYLPDTAYVRTNPV